MRERKKLLYSFIIYYPLLYIFIAAISNGLARKLALIVMFLLMAHIIIEKRKKKILALFIVVSLSIYNLIIFGINYVIHQDFYGYVLLLSFFIDFADKQTIKKINSLLTINRINRICALFLICVLISILQGNGLQFFYEWGTSKPLLYGPYELPHSLSYQLLAMCMYASIGYHKYNRRIFAVYMGVFSILLMWTGVRSAFLTFLTLYFFEYNALKNMQWKMMIVCGVIMVFSYLLFFTDIIYTNPIVEKTMQALRKTSGITNGRGDFNSYLSGIYFGDLNIIEKVLGCSINKLRYYMFLRYGMALQAHNDIFNSLVGMGAVGLVLYMKTQNPINSGVFLSNVGILTK